MAKFWVITAAAIILSLGRVSTSLPMALPRTIRLRQLIKPYAAINWRLSLQILIKY